MNPDFVEILSALSAAQAEFIIVGAHALAAHGVPRATGDLDIWVRPTHENAERVLRALKEFGSPLFDLSSEDLTRNGTVFQIGIAPSRIDILTSITGVGWNEAWVGRLTLNIADVRVAVLGRSEFIANKRATGRPRDLADIAMLESAEAPE
ncbi:MAG TPA: hypothetical protein VE398_10890 [Acidobacteriota bacterium]|nr:hypothetical protein [Acidobacteriota bacterium]